MSVPQLLSRMVIATLQMVKVTTEQHNSLSSQEIFDTASLLTNINLVQRVIKLLANSDHKENECQTTKLTQQHRE